MNAEEITQMIWECYGDIASTGAVNPIIVVINTDDELGRKIAERHVSFLLPQLKAKTLSKDGTLVPVPAPSPLMPGQTKIQGWPLEMLLQVLRTLGCPSEMVAAYRQLAKVPSGYKFWMLSFSGQPKPLCAPMPDRK